MIRVTGVASSDKNGDMCRELQICHRLARQTRDRRFNLKNEMLMTCSADEGAA